MKAIKTKLSEVKLNPNNPRLIKDDNFKKLVQSIKDFPEMLDIRPIVVNADMVILGGNMRFKACKEAGLKEVPIIIADNLTEEQQREFLIKDNVSGGEWDWSLLADWDSEQLEEWGLEVPSFETEVLEAQEDDFDTTPPEEPITVLGDLYEIGEHRLLCGDSTDSDSVALLMNGNKADMVFTDPPYNVDYEGKTKEKLKIQNDKHSLSEFRMLISDVISNLVIFTKKGGSYYVCIPLEVGVTDLFLEKTHLQSVLIWLKNVIVMGRKDYQQKTEPILFLTNKEENNIDEYTEEETYEGIVYGWNFGDSHKYYGGRKQSNVWNFDKPQRNGEHPTMKPILLVAKAINNSSQIENIILDLFLGSGSTMVASHQLKRKCYGMELDPKYCDVIVKRMIKLDPTLIVKRNGVATKDFEL
jgi:site-specific DNA-methyltransferase (adenine-specific)